MAVPENYFYETGTKPYVHNTNRGKWAKSWDFYSVTLSNCLGIRIFLVPYLMEYIHPFMLFEACALGFLTFTLPLFYTQVFLGQFSSSGIISVFRLAPVFKGIGYATLILNIVLCCFFMATAAFPLKIIYDLFESDLPWKLCNNTYSANNCSVIPPAESNYYGFNRYNSESKNKGLPFHQYVGKILKVTETKVFNDFTDIDHHNDVEWDFMLIISLCIFLVFVFIFIVLSRGPSMYGKISRLITTVVFICLISITIRIFCIPKSWEILWDSFSMKNATVYYVLDDMKVFSFIMFIAFGTGWGNILTIASYNGFKENVKKLSLISCCIQMMVLLIVIINCMVVENYIYSIYDYSDLHSHLKNPILYVFVTFNFYFSQFGSPKVWAILLFIGIFLSQFSEVTNLIFTIQTAITDEFEELRIYRKRLIFILTLLLGLFSLLFCSTDSFSSLFGSYSSIRIIQLVVIFIELYVIVYDYGVKYFGLDTKFMSGKKIEKWIIWLMRIVTPLMLILGWVVYFAGLYKLETSSDLISVLILSLTKLIAILCIPGYVLYILKIKKEKCSKVSRPNDWYPVDPTEHENYDNYLSNLNLRSEECVELRSFNAK